MKKENKNFKIGNVCNNALYYFDSVLLVERVYRNLLLMIKRDLMRNRADDISNIQSIVLYYIAVEPITIAELISRGYYLGSNVSYNLKKMNANGYISMTVSHIDKRATIVSVTQKGADLLKNLQSTFSQAPELIRKIDPDFSPNVVNSSLKDMDKIFKNFLMYHTQ